MKRTGPVCAWRGRGMASGLVLLLGAAGARASLLPARLEPNHGQAGPAVELTGVAAGYRLELEPGRIRLKDGAGGCELRLVGATAVNWRPGATLPGRVHDLRGRDPGGWRRNVPSFAAAEAVGAWPGISVIVRADASRLALDFRLAAGVDPRAIGLAVACDGTAGGPEIDRDGGLVVGGRSGPLRLERPFAYQETACGRREVASGFHLAGPGQVGFWLGERSTSLATVIDPTIGYSSFLGGGGGDNLRAILLDDQGFIYLAGTTTSTDFPVVGGVQGGLAGAGDIFIAKLDPGGSSLVFATYLGGRGSDGASGLARDAAGDLYLVGTSESADFPLVAPLRAVLGGQADLVLCKLSADGSRLLVSTYLGGSGFEQGGDLDLDRRTGDVHLVGRSQSTDFPTLNPIQPTNPNPANGSCILAGFPADLGRMLYATYFGGSQGAACNDLATDPAGNVWVVGGTPSTDLPVVGALQPVLAGASDGFLLRLDPTGTAIQVLTYLGGGGSDTVIAAAVDTAGRLHVTGWTGSGDFPRFNPVPPGPRGSNDVFVSRLDPAGAALESSSALGGGAADFPEDIAVGGRGEALVVGRTASADWPVCDPLQASRLGSEDAFLLALDLDRPRLGFSTWLGGSQGGQAFAVAADAAGDLWTAGRTGSADFPVVLPYDATLGGASDGFFTRVVLGTCGTAGPGNSLTAVRPTPSTLRFDWEAVPGADGYVLREDPARDGGFATVTDRPAANQSQLALPAPPLLYYRVAAESCCGEGGL